ncbi:MAG: hypothetical protein PVF45_12200 [Anaerolineae bacterium]|jgi:hypothetical protein
MTHAIRPVNIFILRLWREPGDQEGDAGWRGLIRPLDADAATSGQDEVVFYGLDHLLGALRSLLMDQETSISSRSSPAEPGASREL